MSSDEPIFSGSVNFQCEVTDNDVELTFTIKNLPPEIAKAIKANVDNISRNMVSTLFQTVEVPTIVGKINRDAGWIDKTKIQRMN